MFSTFYFPLVSVLASSAAPAGLYDMIAGAGFWRRRHRSRATSNRATKTFCLHGCNCRAT